MVGFEHIRVCGIDTVAIEVNIVIATRAANIPLVKFFLFGIGVVNFRFVLISTEDIRLVDGAERT